MGRPAIYKETIKKNTINAMKSMGNYRKEYDTVIGIYSELIEQYNILTKLLIESKYEYEVSTSDGGSKKSPLVATLESLRKDIMQYSTILLLNPKAVKEIKKNIQIKSPSGNALANALKGLSDG